MATVTITEQNIQETIDNNGIVLLDFWASWCGPCRAFGPVFEAASGKHADIVFGKVDTEDQQRLAASFGISSIPTIVAFRDKIVLYAEPGALRAPDLESLIGQIRAVDMDEVRAEVAKQQQGATA